MHRVSFDTVCGLAVLIGCACAGAAAAVLSRWVSDGD